jgi:hypothetical protein
LNVSNAQKISIEGGGRERDPESLRLPGAHEERAYRREPEPLPITLQPSGGERIALKGLTISVEQVLKAQGYPNPSRVRAAVKNIAETVATMASRMAVPDACYRRVGIESCIDGELVLVDGTRFHCEAFGKYLSGCPEIVVFVLTLGAGVDHIERNLSANSQLLETVFWETACWMAIEQATKSLVKHLRTLIEPEGLTLTRRMAPGYSFRMDDRKCDWSLLDQAALFGLFHGIEMPVRLLESGGMVPKMSRSGVYGLRARHTSAP